jgi:hypothetical protein
MRSLPWRGWLRSHAAMHGVVRSLGRRSRPVCRRKEKSVAGPLPVMPEGWRPPQGPGRTSAEPPPRPPPRLRVTAMGERGPPSMTRGRVMRRARVKRRCRRSSELGLAVERIAGVVARALEVATLPARRARRASAGSGGRTRDRRRARRRRRPQPPRRQTGSGVGRPGGEGAAVMGVVPVKGPAGVIRPRTDGVCAGRRGRVGGCGTSARGSEIPRQLDPFRRGRRRLIAAEAVRGSATRRR